MEPDIHDRLNKAIYTTIRDNPEYKDQPNISFKSVSIENAIIPKKKQQQQSSSLSSSSSTTIELNLKTEGIIKYNWPTKHYELIPCLLLFTVGFNVDWTISEWVRKETYIQTTFLKLKQNATIRDLKVILLIHKIGSNPLDKEMIEERLGSLKKHLQIDSKYFILYSSNDVITNNIFIKKLCKMIREYSTLYYNNKIKYYKNIEKLIIDYFKNRAVSSSSGSSSNSNSNSSIDESILIMRCYFKISFFYEFQGQSSQALRYYRLCYLTLCNLLTNQHHHHHSIDNIYDQLQTIAEMVHFKICKILLLSNSIGEVFQQFKSHISKFLKIRNEYVWKHYGWLADQYIVLVHLLEYFSVSESLPDSDRSYYYQNAAKYYQKRCNYFWSYHKELKNQQQTKHQQYIRAATASSSSSSSSSCSTTSSPSPVATTSTTTTTTTITNRTSKAGIYEKLTITNLTDSYIMNLYGATEFKGYLITSPKFIGSSVQFMSIISTATDNDNHYYNSSSNNNNGSYNTNSTTDTANMMAMTTTNNTSISSTSSSTHALISLEAQSEIYKQYLIHEELKLDHYTIIMNLLHLALDKTNSSFYRKRGLLFTLIAEQLISEGFFDQAIERLHSSLSLLISEQWIIPSKYVLDLLIKCSISLGNIKELLFSSLTLLANVNNTRSNSSSSRSSSNVPSIIDRNDLEVYHFYVMTILEATLTATTTTTTTTTIEHINVRPNIANDCFHFHYLPVRNHAMFINQSMTPIINNDEVYGHYVKSLNDSILATASSSSSPNNSKIVISPEYHLPNNYIIDMSTTMKMFEITTSFDRKTVELGERVMVTIGIYSKFIDDIEFNEMKLYFTDSAVVKMFRNHGSNNSKITYNSSSTKKSLNDSLLVNNDGIIYTSLLFKSLQTTEFSFYLVMCEPSFTRFIAIDMVMCLERVEFILNNRKANITATAAVAVAAPIDVVDHVDHIDVTKSSISEIYDNDGRGNNNDVDGDHDDDRQVIFTMNAYPPHMIQAMKHSSDKIHSLKDIVGYCESSHIIIKKPTPWITMIEPQSQNINMLLGIIQRLNIYFKIEQKDLIDGYVYLSSDFIPGNEMESLFWYPNVLDLNEIRHKASTNAAATVTQEKKSQHHSSDDSISDDDLNKVRFHPILPVQPFYIPSHSLDLSTHNNKNDNSNNDNTDDKSSKYVIICIPLFLKHDYVSTISINIKLEFNPIGILQSSITKDFNQIISFLSPFDMNFKINKDGSHMYNNNNNSHMHDDSMIICPNKQQLLTSSLICMNSLQNNLQIDRLCLVINDDDDNNNNRYDISSDRNSSNDGQFEVIGCKQSDEYDANINHKVYELLNINNDNYNNNNNNSSSVNQNSCQLQSILKSNEILKRNIKFNFNTITSLSTSSSSSSSHIITTTTTTNNNINDTSSTIITRSNMLYTPSDSYLNNILSLTMKYNESSSTSNHYHIPPSNLIKSLGHVLVSWHIIQAHLLRWDQTSSIKQQQQLIMKATTANHHILDDEFVTLHLDNNDDMYNNSTNDSESSAIYYSRPIDDKLVRLNRNNVFSWLPRLGRSYSSPSALSSLSLHEMRIQTEAEAEAVEEVSVDDATMNSLNLNVTEYAISTLFFQTPNMTVRLFC